MVIPLLELMVCWSLSKNSVIQKISTNYLIGNLNVIIKFVF